MKKFISKVDGAEFQYKFNGTNLEIKADGCDWSDFISEDKRSYSDKEYEELITLLKKERNLNSKGSYDYCLKCDCILTQYEGTICCSCEELYPNFYD